MDEIVVAMPLRVLAMGMAVVAVLTAVNISTC